MNHTDLDGEQPVFVQISFGSSVDEEQNENLAVMLRDGRLMVFSKINLIKLDEALTLESLELANQVKSTIEMDFVRLCDATACINGFQQQCDGRYVVFGSGLCRNRVLLLNSR